MKIIVRIFLIYYGIKLDSLDIGYLFNKFWKGEGSKTALQKMLASISLNVVKKVMNAREHFPIWKKKSWMLASIFLFGKKSHKWSRADFFNIFISYYFTYFKLQ